MKESPFDFLRCPESGSALDALEPWLWSDASGEVLYPNICKTPVLTVAPDAFLLEESLSVSRAMAEFGVDEEVRTWFHSRYGRFNAPDGSVVDSEVLGESYPGFWEAIPVAPMVKHLTATTPEAQIMDWMKDNAVTVALDVGSGQGAMTQRMAQHAAWVFGLERHYYLAAVANHLLPQAELEVGYHDPEAGWQQLTLSKPPVKNAWSICGSLHEPPFVQSSFDWIHCGHVLDLVDHPEEGLARLMALLKPGGYLTLCSPLDFPDVGHFDDLYALLDAGFETLREEHGVPWLRFHHQRRFILHEDWLWMGRLKVN